jgi:hypothetical protein
VQRFQVFVFTLEPKRKIRNDKIEVACRAEAVTEFGFGPPMHFVLRRGSLRPRFAAGESWWLGAELTKPYSLKPLEINCLWHR